MKVPLFYVKLPSKGCVLILKVLSKFQAKLPESSEVASKGSKVPSSKGSK